MSRKRWKSKLKRILRDKAKRVRIETLFRTEDDTVAFYMPFEDKIHIFIDAWATNNYEIWKYCRNRLKVKKFSLEQFLVYGLTKTYIHELCHWASEELNDYQADLIAINLTFPEPLKTIWLEMLHMQRD